MKSLLIIDIQKEYMESYPYELIDKINNKIFKSGKEKYLIIYVKNIRRLKSGNKIYDFTDNLNICSDNILFKDKASAFTNKELEILLKNNNITEIEIIGVDGNGCVASTAKDAVKLGYKTTLLCDYIGIKNRKRFETNKEKLKDMGIIIK